VSIPSAFWGVAGLCALIAALWGAFAALEFRPRRHVSLVTRTVGVALAVLLPVVVGASALSAATVQSRGVLGVVWSAYALSILITALRRLRSMAVVVAVALCALAVVVLGTGALVQALGGPGFAGWRPLAWGVLAFGAAVVVAGALIPRHKRHGQQSSDQASPPSQSHA
jgi:hypothetical protein